MESEKSEAASQQESTPEVVESEVGPSEDLAHMDPIAAAKSAISGTSIELSPEAAPANDENPPEDAVSEEGHLAEPQEWSVSDRVRRALNYTSGIASELRSVPGSPLLASVITNLDRACADLEKELKQRELEEARNGG